MILMDEKKLPGKDKKFCYLKCVARFKIKAN